ncbi:MAG: di-trans,poly-cis-decaprenylcistransferase [Pseudomonadales bacterium]|nr:di-trans,poly-cis-decaprenylcistransferase [Gammaproteobacteria bacterium]NNL57558.1 di-trans,poly-cis-decaprenylcistransferase [Pseudomonadales bacterium]
MKNLVALTKSVKSLFKRRAAGATEHAVVAGLPLPAHVAIIMDGNNRWAQQRNLAGVSGHRSGVETIRKVLSACQENGIKVLTLYAFSSENWQRPEREVQELMKLLRLYLQNELQELHSRGTRMRFIGRRDRLDPDIVALMQRAEQLTAENSGSHLVLAIDYGGRWDIAATAKKLAARVAQGELELAAIDESLFGQQISLADLPEPDLCIRTGAEHRLSNFLLWQLSYAELYFCDCYWPDFDQQQFNAALHEFGVRQRRFGKTESQVQTGRASLAPGRDAASAGVLPSNCAAEDIKPAEYTQHSNEQAQQKVAGWPPHA